MDLALNNQQRLICHKIQPTNHTHIYIYTHTYIFLMKIKNDLSIKKQQFTIPKRKKF